MTIVQRWTTPETTMDEQPEAAKITVPFKVKIQGQVTVTNPEPPKESDDGT